MSNDVIKNLQIEMQAMREYWAKQENRIQEILTTAFQESSDVKVEEQGKVKDLQESLEKSKAAARAADGKIKLLQYQLAKLKNQASVDGHSKKVTFEDESSHKSDKSSNYLSDAWLLHWIHMKPVCRQIQSITTSISMKNLTEAKSNEDICIEEEISRCMEMGNILDELGILNESFVTYHNGEMESENTDASNEEKTDEISDSLTTQKEIPQQSENVDEFIPKKFQEKLFFAVSPTSVETKTDNFQYEERGSPSTALDSISNNEEKERKISTGRSHCSLREYMEKKEVYGKSSMRQETVSSPVSVFEVGSAVEEILSPLPTTNLISSSSVISPSELKNLFRGFGNASTVNSAESPAGRNQVVNTSTISALTPPTCHAALEDRRRQYLQAGSNTVSTKKSMHSTTTTSSSMKTISRLLDCGSSVATDHFTEKSDVSCHTLTTEFDLLHDMRDYDKLQIRYVIDIEQPLLNSKLILR